MSGGRNQRGGSKAPDKGSFPLDHFKECNEEAIKYTECTMKHELMPKKCRKLQQEYLQCRMNKGLMEKEEWEKLGFTEEATFENEQEEKKMLFNKIQFLKKRARENLIERQEALIKMKNEELAKEKDESVGK